MPVQENQPLLRWDLERLFADPTRVSATGTCARRVSKGHGRLEMRQLRASTALVGDSDWPGLAQARCVEREVVRLTTGEVRREQVSAVTSLPPDHADAGALLARWQGHWGIEHRWHGVRDVGCGEDRSATRVGGGPQGLATLRHTVIGTLRAHGHLAIATTRRALARHPVAALALIGL